MPKFNSLVKYTMTNAGAAVTWATDDNIHEYVLNGSATLAGSYTFAASGTDAAGGVYRVIYNATMTLNGNNITIFGRALTQAQALSKFTLIAIYDGSAYQTWILPDVGVTGRFYHGVQNTTVPSIGGTVTLNPALDKGFQLYSASSVRLSSDYSIGGTGTPQDGDEFYVIWNGGVTPAGNTVTIFGEVLSDSQVLSGDVLIHVVYNGALAAWTVAQGATNPASSIVSQSYAQLATLVSGSALEINRVYFVNDRNVWIKAIEANRFELRGTFKMLAPDYQNVSTLYAGVWVSGMAAPTIGNLYAYNNFLWASANGTVGSAPNTDAVAWTCQGTYGSGTWKDWVNKTGTAYQVEIYDCEYDFTKDWIQLLEDKQRGNKGGLSWQQEQSVALGFNVIDKFQWGRNTHFSNLFVEAYLNNVNTTTGVYTANYLPPGEQMVLGVTESSNMIPIVYNSKQCPAYCKKLVIPSASVLTLNSVPLTIVPSPGAGKAIEIISALFGITFNSIVYATNTAIELINVGANKCQFNTDSNCLISSVTRIGPIKNVENPGPAETQIIANTALQVRAVTGNPTAGNSVLTVWVFYHIIET